MINLRTLIDVNSDVTLTPHDGRCCWNFWSLVSNYNYWEKMVTYNKFKIEHHLPSSGINRNSSNKMFCTPSHNYPISANSFCGNYSFFEFGLMYSDLLPKLFKGGNYSRAETIRGNTVFENVDRKKPSFNFK